MTRCPKCGSYAINDDPERVLCDKCWRDAEIERLRAWIARTAEDEHLKLLDKESRDEEEPMCGEEPKKHRTMWG